MNRRLWSASSRYVLAALPMLPALAINVDWSGKTSAAWVLAAVAGIILAPVIIEASRHARSWYVGIFLMFVGVFGMYVNGLVAMKTASITSEDEKTRRKNENIRAEQASSQSSQTSQRRSELVKLAGEEPPEVYEQQLNQAIAANPGRWRSTVECNPLKTTLPESVTFCAGISAVKLKLQAAKDIKAIDNGPQVTGQATTSEDPFADNFPAFAAGFGVHVDKANATPHLNGSRSIWLELMDGVGPMAILLLWDVATGAARALAPGRKPPRPAPNPYPRSMLAELRERLAGRPMPPPAPPAEMSAPPPPPVDKRALRAKQAAERAADLQRRHDIFVADELETFNGVSMASGEPWRMWKARCAARREDAGDRRSFSLRLGKNFSHDPNSGRPRFLNVRAKPKAAQLTLVR
jgi:hypothetical protein